MKIRLAGTVPESITDGRGVRYSLFTQGCPHHCKGCHNPETHSFEGGTWRAVADLFDEIQSNPILAGVTFSGGEPFAQPAPLAELARLVHGIGRDVTVFTGWTYEELTAMHNPAVDALLAQTDILVDGRFVEAQKNLELYYRGSENQRVIDMNESRKQNQVVVIRFDGEIHLHGGAVTE